MLYGSRVVVCFFAFFFSLFRYCGHACHAPGMSILFLLHHKQPFEETNENTFLLSTHKVYLKHKKQTQIHVVSSE